MPHRLYWYEESLNILFTPIRQKLIYNPCSRWLKKFIIPPFSAFLFYCAKFFGILRLRADRTACKVRRAQVLWEEAEKRGIAMSEVLLFGKPIDVYVAERLNNQPIGQSANQHISQRGIIFSGLPRPQGYDNRWLELMDDKFLLKQKLRAANFPVPRGGSVTGTAAALKIFGRIDKPAIVKPRAGSRGRHTTTFIYSEADLRRAVKIAQQLCHWVIVEEQLTGPIFRATVIGGKLAGVLRGDEPQITGDGQHKISELIGIKNPRSHPGVKDIIIDDAMELFLSRQNLDINSVPYSGRLVSLSEKIGVNYGGSSSEDYEICHPDNKELFLRAAAVVGDPIVGFDFIIPNITRSFREQKCGFIEANSLPFINLHHDPLLGSPRNAAALVWDLVGWR